MALNPTVRLILNPGKATCTAHCIKPRPIIVLVMARVRQNGKSSLINSVISRRVRDGPTLVDRGSTGEPHLHENAPP